MPIWKRPVDGPRRADLRERGAARARREPTWPPPTAPTRRWTPTRPARRGADLVVAPSEPYPFAERHRAELERAAADVRFVDGRDLLWWGTRTRGALERLAAGPGLSRPPPGSDRGLRAGSGTAMSAATATIDQVQRSARRASDSPWADRWARLGFVARGVVYLVIGLIALDVVRDGGRGDEASKEGALREIAERPFGGALLVVLAVGLAGYAMWRATEAVWGKRDEEDEKKRTAKRLGSAARAVFYARVLRHHGPVHPRRAERRQPRVTSRSRPW